MSAFWQHNSPGMYWCTMWGNEASIKLPPWCLIAKEKGSPGLHPGNIPNQEIIEGHDLSQRPEYIEKFTKLRPECLRLLFDMLHSRNFSLRGLNPQECLPWVDPKLVPGVWQVTAFRQTFWKSPPPDPMNGSYTAAVKMAEPAKTCLFFKPLLTEAFKGILIQTAQLSGQQR